MPSKICCVLLLIHGFMNCRPRTGLVHKCVMVKKSCLRIRFSVDEPDENSRITSLSLSISNNPHTFEWLPSRIVLTGTFLEIPSDVYLVSNCKSYIGCTKMILKSSVHTPLFILYRNKDPWAVICLF